MSKEYILPTIEELMGHRSRKFDDPPITIEDLERDSEERQFKNNARLSDEEKNKFLVGYESLVRRMERANYQMESFIKTSIEKEIERPLTSEEKEQIFKKFSDYGIKDVYNTVMSIVKDNKK